MSIKKSIIHGIKWTASAKMVSQLATWGITIYIMRLLTPEDYGLLAMATVFTAFLLLLSEVGLGPALVQTKEIDKERLQQAFGVIIVSNVILTGIANIFAGGIAQFFDEPRLENIVRLLSIQFPINALTIIPGVLLQRNLSFKQQSLIELTTAILTSVSTLIFATKGLGVNSIVFGTLTGALVRCVSLYIVSPIYLKPSFRWKSIKDQYSYGRSVSTGRILWFFFNQIDTLIIGKILGKDALGIYSVAMHIASMPVQRISAIIGQVAFPVLARYQNDITSIRKTTIDAVSYISFIGFPLLWGISSVSDDLIIVLLGETWQSAIIPLKLISIMLPLRLIANILPSATDAIGKPELNLRNIQLATSVMPIAFLIGAQYGIIGVTLAWVTIYPLILLFNAFRITKPLGIKKIEFLSCIIPSLITALLMYIIVKALYYNTLYFSSTERLIILPITGASTYLTLSYFTNKKIILSLISKANK
jgi:teichuronic acid exporter